MLEMTVECTPGALTIEKATEIQRAFLNLLNVIAEDIEPGCGEMFKADRLEWINDGKDTMTLRVVR